MCGAPNDAFRHAVLFGPRLVQTSKFRCTLIRYTEGHEEEADFVAQQLIGGADTEQVETIFGADIAVVLGQDFGGVVDEVRGTLPAPAVPPPSAPTDPGGPGTTTSTTIRGEVPQAPPEVECG